MAGWHHWLHGHEFGWTLGVSDGQGGLVCCNSWGRKESDTTERLNWTDLFATPWIVALQSPLSMTFSWQEYWSGFATPFSRGSSHPRNLTLVSCITCIGSGLFTTELPEKPCLWPRDIFFGGFQCPPVDGCSTASCKFGAFTGGYEHMSFYSAV